MKTQKKMPSLETPKGKTPKAVSPAVKNIPSMPSTYPPAVWDWSMGHEMLSFPLSRLFVFLMMISFSGEVASIVGTLLERGPPV